MCSQVIRRIRAIRNDPLTELPSCRRRRRRLPRPTLCVQPDCPNPIRLLQFGYRIDKTESIIEKKKFANDVGSAFTHINSGADSHKASMALNMDGTCMKGLYLSSYQDSTLRHAVELLQLLIRCSVYACFHKRKIMKEDARFECNNTSSSSIIMFGKIL